MKFAMSFSFVSTFLFSLASLASIATAAPETKSAVGALPVTLNGCDGQCSIQTPSDWTVSKDGPEYLAIKKPGMAIAVYFSSKQGFEKVKYLDLVRQNQTAHMKSAPNAVAFPIVEGKVGPYKSIETGFEFTTEGRTQRVLSKNVDAEGLFIEIVVMGIADVLKDHDRELSAIIQSLQVKKKNGEE